MRVPSRRLPPRSPRPPAPWAYRVAGLVLVACLAFALWHLGTILITLLWRHPRGMLAACAGLAGLGWLVTQAEDYPPRRLDRLTRSRPAKDVLCRFARDFDCRRTDTWLVRAVFEETQICLAERRQPVPIRAADRLADLGVDGEDVDDIGGRAAIRAGYALDSTRGNPLYGKVETVGDIVRFLQLQPCTRHAPGR